LLSNLEIMKVSEGLTWHDNKIPKLANATKIPVVRVNE